jgi:hypothetical protein
LHIPKENPFKTPEGYFDDLPGKTLNRLNSESAGKSSKTKTIDFLKPYLYMAAGFTLLVVVFRAGLGLLVDKDSLHPVEPQTTTINSEASYEEELISDESVLYETITELTQDKKATEISSEALEEYLMSYDLTIELTE